MQFRLLSGFIIFIGSYLPLALILAVQDIPISWWSRSFCDLSDIGSCSFNPFSNPYLSLAFILVTCVSVIISNFSLKKISFPFEGEVKSSKTIPNDIINYVFPYVVSFMGISYDAPEKLLGFSVFLFWMFAITYKSGQIIMNPLLLMFGWKLYEAKIQINGQERDVRVLKKGVLTPGYYQFQSIQDFYITRGCQ
ncbi:MULTISPECIES: hypothetical protein [Shewanella]|jgi:hypothetical protein|uniref:hypothetical protein n=1 Tax=Shewanella TaxID=22 RepID=UPI000C7A22E5|nr:MULTISPECIES: hypothetical protein [Shewanella]AVT49507.1 hypothetical protein C8I07_18245 [Shewanella baltica]PKI03858.1 hypothetical protein CXF78_10650 [Shewanella sp. 11B5]|tara:strand:- start:8584 stop:9165 length:582 start_codon:yes stop_codon:yes gene_type:complete